MIGGGDLILVLVLGGGFGPCRRGHVGIAAKGLIGLARFRRNIRSGGKILLGRWGISEGRALGDGREVGPMGLGDISQGLGVGRKPCLFAAGAADRPPRRPE